MRQGTIGGLLLVCVIVAASATVVNMAHNQPGREIVMSPVMDHCRNEQNTSPDKEEQLKFLRSHKLTVYGDWVDATFGEVGTDQITVRYYTGETSTNPNFQLRCQFGLVLPERDPARHRFVLAGQPFDPKGGYCLSTLPPTFNADFTIATLRCDKVV